MSKLFWAMLSFITRLPVPRRWSQGLDFEHYSRGIITFPLTIRKTATGDRFVPLGMNGSKLISDYMTDKKRSLFEKQRQLVVEDASERVVWLVNERPDNRFRVTHSTTSVLKIEMLS